MWYILREIDQNKEIKVKNEAKEKKKKGSIRVGKFVSCSNLKMTL